MKKIFVAMLSAILCAVTIVMVGCAGSSAFEGEYKAVDASIVNEYLEEGIQSIKIREGVSIESNIVIGEEKIDVSCLTSSSLTSSSIGVSKLQYKIEMEDRQESVESYCDGNYIYERVKFDGNEIKTKREGGFAEIANGILYESDISALYSSYLTYKDMPSMITTYYFASANGESKVKIVQTGNNEDDFRTEVTSIFVFDSDKELIAFSYDLSTTEDDEKMEIKLNIEKWHGTIKMPVNLDDYVLED